MFRQIHPFNGAEYLFYYDCRHPIHSETTPFPAPTGCAHRLVPARPEPDRHSGGDALADHLYFHPQFPECSNRHQPGAHLCRLRQLHHHAAGPGFLGNHRADPVLYLLLGQPGIDHWIGSRPVDPFPSLGLEIPAFQSDHPLGRADHRQRLDVALDLQRGFRRAERDLDAARADQTLHPLAHPAGPGHAAGHRGGRLAYDAVRRLDPAGCPGGAACGTGRSRRRGWRQRLAALLEIRLPLLRPAILVALIARTVDAFRVFDIVYIITGGGPASSTMTITYLTYLNSFSYGKQGIGAALSFLISFITIIMALFISVCYTGRRRTSDRFAEILQ